MPYDFTCCPVEFVGPRVVRCNSTKVKNSLRDPSVPELLEQESKNERVISYPAYRATRRGK